MKLTGQTRFVTRSALVAYIAAVVSLAPRIAQADCCLRPAATVPEPATASKLRTVAKPPFRDCCTLKAGPKGEKFFEANVQEMVPEKGEVVLTGDAIHEKSKAFVLSPKEKIRDFSKGVKVKAILKDQEKMEFQYEFLKK